jgi:hypothetical protein
MAKIFEMPAIEVVKFETETVLAEPASWNSGGNDIGWEE